MAHVIATSSPSDIDAYLEPHQHKSLLRFITCGSVDDGKSTLIGRLLYDSKMIFEDQLAALEADSKKVGTQGGEIDFALLVDGLAAEREQGITIDVAYRFFSTDKRKFIVADTPGHEQYTRNMVTGASTADLAVILIDARKGVLTQTRRHSYLVSLLGIRHVVLAVNKMDLVDYRPGACSTRSSPTTAPSPPRSASPTSLAIPISAPARATTSPSPAPTTPWYAGPTLMRLLEDASVEDDLRDRPFRMPVQWVNRPNLDFRGFSGLIASGVVAAGRPDQGPALRPREHGRAHRHLRRRPAEAVAGQSVTLTLADEIDVSPRRRAGRRRRARRRSPTSSRPRSSGWTDEPMLPGRPYLLKLGDAHGRRPRSPSPSTRSTSTPWSTWPAKQLELNEIGVCNLSARRSRSPSTPTPRTTTSAASS